MYTSQLEKKEERKKERKKEKTYTHISLSIYISHPIRGQMKRQIKEKTVFSKRDKKKKYHRNFWQMPRKNEMKS